MRRPSYGPEFESQAHYLCLSLALIMWLEVVERHIAMAKPKTKDCLGFS